MVTGNKKSRAGTWGAQITQELAQRSSLYCLISDDNVEYAVQDAEEIVSIGRVEFGPDLTLDVLPVPSGEFAKVHLAFRPSFALLAPAVFNSEEDQRQLIEEHYKQSFEELSTSQIPELDANVIYTSSSAWTNLWIDRYPNAVTSCSIALNLSGMARKLKFATTATVYAESLGSSLEIAIWNKNTLELFNIYPTQTENDVIYHLMNACQQLNINLDETLVTVGGNVRNGTELDNLLKEYIPRFGYFTGLHHVRFHKGLSMIARQEFVSLLNLVACGS